jgi:murein DD-endopeptidase MepM/ murein hydrolase activator NlpD
MKAALMRCKVILLVVSLILVVSSGCNLSSASTPTVAATPSETPAQLGLPTAVQFRTPTLFSTTDTAAPRVQPRSAPTQHPTASPTPQPAPTAVVAAALLFSYPIGTPGKALGDGFFVRHGAQVENTWYNPGYWHTAEDWYTIDGDTAGAQVYAIAAGEVVYAGSNYPGRVVIIRHADNVYSMYGHLDPALNVRVGQLVVRGEPLGTVLRRNDKTPNHLHFEVRTFLTAREVNGAAPRYGFRCGRDCPPGPGYWPISAPDLPNDRGWRNPTHVIARRMFASDAASPLREVVVAMQPASQTVGLWSAAPSDATRTELSELALHPGERFALLNVYAGSEDTRETSALAYRLWYHIQLPDGRHGWVQAAIPSTFETGSDGRPSSVYFNFFPV